MHQFLVCFGLLLLACATFAAADACAAPSARQTEPRDGERLRYFAWHRVNGEQSAENPGEKVHLDLTGMKLNLSFSQKSGPSQVWYGQADDAIRAEIVQFLAANPPDAEDFSGLLDRRKYQELSDREKAENCVWQLLLRYDRKDGTSRELAIQGMDTGDNPARLRFQDAVEGFFRERIGRLQAEMPKNIEYLSFTANTPEQPFYHISGRTDEEVSLSRHLGGKQEEDTVERAVLARLGEIIRTAHADSWQGFVPQNWKRNAAHAFSLEAHYDTGQNVWVRGILNQPGGEPAGFQDFRKALCTALDEALDGPADMEAERTKNPWNQPRHQGLTDFRYAESGMSHDSQIIYELVWMRTPKGRALKLKRKVGSRIAECRLLPEDLDRLEALIKELNLVRWDGFHGTARDVLDGNGFGLAIKWADGGKVSADGSMRFPKGYREAVPRIKGFFDALLRAKGAVETLEER